MPVIRKHPFEVIAAGVVQVNVEPASELIEICACGAPLEEQDDIEAGCCRSCSAPAL